jgi:Ran GTPase-activating protein (RanGAP) involved in mRNA processing and transport
MLAPEIIDNGAILSLDMSNNFLNADDNRGMDYLGPAVAASNITSLNIASNFLYKNGGIGAIISMLDNGALSVLSLKSNRLATKDGGKALAQALANNSTLKELDVSSNNWNAMGTWKGDGPGFAQELAIGIKDNGAMTKFDISSNNILAEGGKALAEGLKGNQVIKELNFSGNMLGCSKSLIVFEAFNSDTSGIIAIADVIPGMGALTKLNMSDNSHPTLLNGMSGRFPDLTKVLTEMADGHRPFVELDLSGNSLIPGKAPLLMRYISARPLGLELCF